LPSICGHASGSGRVTPASRSRRVRRSKHSREISASKHSREISAATDERSSLSELLMLSNPIKKPTYGKPKKTTKYIPRDFEHDNAISQTKQKRAPHVRRREARSRELRDPIDTYFQTKSTSNEHYSGQQKSLGPVVKEPPLKPRPPPPREHRHVKARSNELYREPHQPSSKEGRKHRRFRKTKRDAKSVHRSQNPYSSLKSDPLDGFPALELPLLTKPMNLQRKYPARYNSGVRLSNPAAEAPSSHRPPRKLRQAPLGAVGGPILSAPTRSYQPVHRIKQPKQPSAPPQRILPSEVKKWSRKPRRYHFPVV